MGKNGKRRGDRFDATWVRDADPMHGFTPYLFPHRADNEAFIEETIDLTTLNAFLEKKNQGLDRAHRYTIFHCVASALIKTVTLRPKLNYFIQGMRLYKRDKLTLSFVVKKQFADDGGEALAFVEYPPETTLDSFHESIMKEIFECRRSDAVDNSTAGMAFFMKLPRFVLRPVVYMLRRLDFFGKVPYDLIRTDPNYASIFISNLGSIKLNAAYHHLNNWGTNSLFVVIGQKHVEPVFSPDGSYVMHEMLHVGITLDERIADGYYYARSIELFKYLMEHPEELDRPANEEVAK